MWLPPAAAEALEGTVQPRAAGPRVHGANADCCLSCHVCMFKAVCGPLFICFFLFWFGLGFFVPLAAKCSPIFTC